MFQQLIAGLFDGATDTYDEIEDFYARVLPRVIFWSFVYVILLWGFNALGVRGVNSVIFFLTALAVIAFGLIPSLVLGMIGLGALAGTLRRGDTIMGAWDGLTVWYKIVLNIMFYLLIVAWWLMIMPYEKAPLSFFPAAAMVLFLLIAVLKFEIGGNWLRNFVVFVTLKVLIFSTIDTLTGLRLSKALSTGWESVLAYTFDDGTTATSIPTYTTRSMVRLNKSVDASRPMIFNIAGKTTLYTIPECYRPSIWSKDGAKTVRVDFGKDPHVTYITPIRNDVERVKVWLAPWDIPACKNRT